MVEFAKVANNSFGGWSFCSPRGANEDGSRCKLALSLLRGEARRELVVISRPGKGGRRAVQIQMQLTRSPAVSEWTGLILIWMDALL